MTLYCEENLLVQLDGDLSLEFSDDGDVGIFYQDGYPIYTGATEVTPKVTDQYLYTSGKAMSTDIHILEVPYYETTNVSGTTVYIANEV